MYEIFQFSKKKVPKNLFHFEILIFFLNSCSSSVTATASSTVSTDGVFLLPPNRDGSVSPSAVKKEQRSTSMIAGKNCLTKIFIKSNGNSVILLKFEGRRS